MSFGASPSDIIIVVTFCRALYRKCRDAGGEYDEISREVRGLHTVLRHLKYEVEAPESSLNKDRTIWGQQLAPIIGDCDFTLRQLDGLIMKYGRLASGGGGSPTTPRILWDKMRFGSNEMDQLGGIRVKLISHKTSLTLFLDTIQLHQSGRMATTLDNHGGQLDVILDKVDNIAARMTAKSGSVMTNYEDDDKEVWKQFRRELVAEGFSSDVLQQHKDVLRAYIRQIDQEGLLIEVPIDPKVPPPPVGQNTERWLESVQNAPSAPSVSSEDVQPSLDSLNTGTDDSGAKEMVFREDNMKFPQSMKMERPKPETRRDGISQRQLEIPTSEPAKERTRSDASRRSVSKPKLVTSNEKENYYLNTDGSSEEDSGNEDELMKRSKSPSEGQIIRTSDLIAQSQALTIRPSASPTSFKSSQGSFIDDDVVPRSMAYRPKKVKFGASPSRSGGITTPNASNRSGTSPGPEPIRFKPDSQGNEIPADAKWTKINRRLVSPEVLEQDRMRYEAYPEFVAVLGVLSRSEIQSLASRSHELRTARHLRNHPPPPQVEVPPPQPPRPIPVPIPTPIQQTRSRGGRDTPSSESDHHSSDSDQTHRRPRYKEHRSYPNYTHSPNTGYPNRFGQPVAPPSPAWSPVQQGQPMWMPQPPPQSAQGGIWIPTSPQQGQQTTPMFFPSPSREEGRDGHRSREPRRRHSSPPRSRDRERDRERGEHRERDQGHKEKEKPKSRWKENLTAASIGGAAVSLLNVLSEAAEGL